MARQFNVAGCPHDDR